MTRISDTGADYEARTYEESGLDANTAWSLVLRTFEDRVRELSELDKDRAKTFYFTMIGPMS